MVFTWNYKKKNKKIQHNFSVVVVVLVSTILQQFPPGMITRTSHCLSISKEYFQPTWPLDTPKKVHVLTTSLSKLYNNYYSTNSVGTVPGKRLPWFPSSSSTSLEQGPTPTEENSTPHEDKYLLEFRGI